MGPGPPWERSDSLWLLYVGTSPSAYVYSSWQLCLVSSCVTDSTLNKCGASYRVWLLRLGRKRYGGRRLPSCSISWKRLAAMSGDKSRQISQKCTCKGIKACSQQRVRSWGLLTPTTGVSHLVSKSSKVQLNLQMTADPVSSLKLHRTPWTRPPR